MPTERFYRLPEEKQKLICDAAIKEFARVPIDKVSINKIIKEADISRGSFYTYFKDKWDVLKCIFEEGQKQMNQFCKEELEKSGGNIWTMLEKLLEQIIKSCFHNKDNIGFIKNVMAHSNSEDFFRGFTDQIEVQEDIRNEFEHWIYEKTDKKCFNSQEFEEFHRFLMMALAAMGMEVRGFYQGQTEERAKSEFSKKLELLRYGVCSRQHIE